MTFVEVLWLAEGDIDLTRSGRMVARDVDAALRASARPVLVVDDDDSIRDMVTSVLRSVGYSVRAAADGEAALAAAAAETPALVLLDLRMPRVDGWEFARRLEERGPRPPIIVMTAARDARSAAAEIGADGHLPKPFDIDQLLTQVARYVEERGN